jgi:hypothetical protein
VIPAFAQLKMASGDADSARAMLEQCIHWIDDYHLKELSGVYALRVKANALLLLGEKDRALELLGESFAAQDYLQWWYTLQRDPLWDSLRDDPRFRTIDGAVRQHVSQQAAILEELRRQGVIPRRSFED